MTRQSLRLRQINREARLLKSVSLCRANSPPLCVEGTFRVGSGLSLLMASWLASSGRLPVSENPRDRPKSSFRRATVTRCISNWSINNIRDWSFEFKSREILNNSVLLLFLSYIWRGNATKKDRGFAVSSFPRLRMPSREFHKGCFSNDTLKI